MLVIYRAFLFHILNLIQCLSRLNLLRSLYFLDIKITGFCSYFWILHSHLKVVVLNRCYPHLSSQLRLSTSLIRMFPMTMVWMFCNYFVSTKHRRTVPYPSSSNPILWFLKIYRYKPILVFLSWTARASEAICTYMISWSHWYTVQ